MNCPACKKTLPSDLSTCPHCGHKFGGVAGPGHRPRVLVDSQQRDARTAQASECDAAVAVPAAWAMPANVVASAPVDVEPEDSTVPTLPPQPAATVASDRGTPGSKTPPSMAGGEPDGADSSVRQGLADDLLGDAIPAGTDTIVDVHRRVSLARTWRRVLAATVDGIAVMALSSLYLFVAISRLPDGVGPARGTGFDRLIDAALVYHQATVPGAVVMLALLVLYEAVFVVVLGQTPGLMLMRCHVISARSRQISWVQSGLRAVTAAAGLLLLGIGWSLQITNPRHQALHDRLAGTLVGIATDEITTLVVDSPKLESERAVESESSMVFPG